MNLEKVDKKVSSKEVESMSSDVKRQFHRLELIMGSKVEERVGQNVFKGSTYFFGKEGCALEVDEFAVVLKGRMANLDLNIEPVKITFESIVEQCITKKTSVVKYFLDGNRERVGSDVIAPCIIYNDESSEFLGEDVFDRMPQFEGLIYSEEFKSAHELTVSIVRDGGLEALIENLKSALGVDVLDIDLRAVVSSLILRGHGGDWQTLWREGFREEDVFLFPVFFSNTSLFDMLNVCEDVYSGSHYDFKIRVENFNLSYEKPKIDRITAKEAIEIIKKMQLALTKHEK